MRRFREKDEDVCVSVGWCDLSNVSRLVVQPPVNRSSVKLVSV